MAIKKKTMRSVKFGVIADTHVYDRETKLPLALARALKGVDFIVHAGDISTPAVIRELAKIAPVKAVLGNKADDLRFFKEKLPEKLIFNIGEVRIAVTHGATPSERSLESFLGRRPLKGTPAQRLAYKVKSGLKTFGVKRVSNKRIIKRLLKEFKNQADCVIFGHSHIPFADYIDGVFFFNPGDAQYVRKKTIHWGILRIRGKKIEYELISFDLSENEKR